MCETSTIVHGIVLYTISDASTRQSIESFVKTELRGTPIDQSTLSLPRTGDTKAKESLQNYINDCNLSFEPNDFIRICYSCRLVCNKADNDDQIIIYTIK